MKETTVKTNTGEDFRLPKTVQPTLYDIALTPDLEHLVFTGTEIVDVVVLEETSQIVLHTKELDIKVVVFTHGKKSLRPTSIQMDARSEQAVFLFERTLPKGEATLSITFSGILNDQMAGFYRSTYELGGQKKVMATTQFEDSDARRAFPCWDEPAIKARFKITLVVPEGLEALSNMLPEKTTLFSAPTPDKKIVRFATSPLMSTYLVAFIVGELEHIEAATKRGTLVRVFATPSKQEQGRFALECGIRCLEFYEDYFGVPYPLPKLDMVAIPDFAAGAMENWGLVTYRETAILYDPLCSPLARKQRVAIVVAHEIAHMWFGDLVTMEWWTQLWLNEGFALWMEYLAVDHMFPDWNVWDRFVSDEYASALADDGLRSTHPVEMIIRHPSELRQSFDTISYQKGASIIRMLHAHLGPKAFQRGMQLYIKRHAYQNTSTEDLWQALEDASGKPVRALMDTWTKQPGYPMITIQERGGTVVLTQSRFLSGGDTLLPEEEAQRWNIPIEHITKEDGYPQALMLSQQSVTFAKPRDIKNGWVKLNAGQVALLRVSYPVPWLEQLKCAVMRKELPPIDRLGLLNDLSALTRAGHMPTVQLLSFLEAYADENSPEVWEEILTNLSGLSRLIPSGTQTRTHFDAYARSILANIVRKKGWEEEAREPHTHKMLRPRILGAYGKHGDEATVEEAKRRFALFLEKPGTINPNLRPLVCALAARVGDKQVHETLIACYMAAGSQEEKTELLVAVGNFRDTELLRGSLEFSMTEHVRKQDVMFVFNSVASNEHGRELAWQFLQEQWSVLHTRHAGALNILSHIIEGVVSALDSHGHADQVERFFSQNPVPKLSRAIANSLERVRNRAQQIERDGKAIEEWLLRWTEVQKKVSRD